MAYIINKSNGQILINLLDGTADGPQVNPGLNVCDLNLVGKNYPTYGEIQNENFVRLLENFNNTTPPTTPLQGQLWYDSGTGFLKVYNGAGYVPVSPVTTSATAPSSPAAGDVWLDTTNDQFKIYNSTEWLVVGPGYSKLDGKSGALTETVYDTLGNKHTVIKFYTNNHVSAISSFDQAFTPNVAITGFSTISPGITLSSTNFATLLYGTATNSQQLGNVAAVNYARSDITTTFAANVNVGGGKLQLTTLPSGDVSITNSTSSSNTNFYNNIGGFLVRTLTVNGTTGEITVGVDPTNNLGIATKQYVDASISTAISPLATINSPSLTGIPLAPTPATSDNSTKIATTQFTQAAIAASTQALWLGSSKFVSTTTPTSGDGNVGDFWFQI
jgi:hypothetical protein